MTHGQTATDEDLMERVQAGDPVAFAELFRRHGRGLTAWLIRTMRDPQRAEDCAQETWLSVHRARGTWSRESGRFRTWLFRIAINAGRDQGRRQQRRPLILTDEPLLIPFHEHPVERLALRGALRGLPEHLREAFVLGSVHGMDHVEIAQRMGITPDNARARLSRARRELRDQLADS